MWGIDPKPIATKRKFFSNNRLTPALNALVACAGAHGAPPGADAAEQQGRTTNPT